MRIYYKLNHFSYLWAFNRGPRTVGWLICPASSTIHQSNRIPYKECRDAVRAVQTTKRAQADASFKALTVRTVRLSNRYLKVKTSDQNYIKLYWIKMGQYNILSEKKKYSFYQIVICLSIMSMYVRTLLRLVVRTSHIQF